MTEYWVSSAKVTRIEWVKWSRVELILISWHKLNRERKLLNWDFDESEWELFLRRPKIETRCITTTQFIFPKRWLNDLQNKNKHVGKSCFFLSCKIENNSPCPLKKSRGEKPSFLTYFWCSFHHHCHHQVTKLIASQFWIDPGPDLIKNWRCVASQRWNMTN